MRRFISTEGSVARSFAAVAFALVMGLSASQAGAASFNLADLITNQTVVTVGDKEFSAWSATFTADNCGAPNDCGPLTAAGITVNTVNQDALHHGLQFVAQFEVDGGDAELDILLGYSVTSTGNSIKDIELAFGGNALGTGTANINETAKIGSTVVGNIFVYLPPNDCSDVPNNCSASANLIGGPYAAGVKIDILKDIALDSGTTGSVNFSFVDQIISQENGGGVIPEPSSVLLLGSGLFSLGLWGLRRRGAK